MRQFYNIVLIVVILLLNTFTIYAQTWTTSSIKISSNSQPWLLTIRWNIENVVWDECSTPSKILYLSYKWTIISSANVLDMWDPDYFKGLTWIESKNPWKRTFLFQKIPVLPPYSSSDYKIVDESWTSYDLYYFDKRREIIENDIEWSTSKWDIDIYYPFVRLLCDAEKSNEIYKNDLKQHPEKYTPEQTKEWLYWLGNHQHAPSPEATSVISTQKLIVDFKDDEWNPLEWVNITMTNSDEENTLAASRSPSNDAMLVISGEGLASFKTTNIRYVATKVWYHDQTWSFKLTPWISEVTIALNSNGSKNNTFWTNVSLPFINNTDSWSSNNQVEHWTVTYNDTNSTHHNSTTVDMSIRNNVVIKSSKYSDSKYKMYVDGVEKKINQPFFTSARSLEIEIFDQSQKVFYKKVNVQSEIVLDQSISIWVYILYGIGILILLWLIVSVIYMLYYFRSVNKEISSDLLKKEKEQKKKNTTL